MRIPVFIRFADIYSIGDLIMSDMDRFQDELSSEIEAILSGDFQPSITETRKVPTEQDGLITFPNLDSKSIGCKLLESAILYIDIRGSTDLSHAHRPNTMAKLYSAFVRAMVRCADYYGGKVRGVIGDRVMVIFDSDLAAIHAVETAVLMNSVVIFVLNRLFDKNAIKCGIGIDHGKMLVTKTGVSRRGNESSSYRSLVWLGRPANVASKLADIANKEHSHTRILVDEYHENPFNPFGGGLNRLGAHFLGAGNNSTVRTKTLDEFLSSFVHISGNQFAHTEPTFRSFNYRRDAETYNTSPILATNKFVRKYKAECRSVRGQPRKWNLQASWIEAYGGTPVGCSAVDPALRRTMLRLRRKRQ